MGAGVLAGAAVLASAVPQPGRAATAASTPGWRLTQQYPAASRLTAVAATGATDAFAVGYQYRSNGVVGADPLLALHWDGSAWHPLPQPPRPSGFQPINSGQAVTASSASNAWFLASAAKNGIPGSAYTVAQRWNGHQWVDQAVLPGLGPVVGAATSSPSDAWVFSSNLVLHYNGRQWQPASFPIDPEQVTALPGSDIWVAGMPKSLTGDITPADLVVEHYSKGAWHQLPAASFGFAAGDGLSIDGIVADSDTSVWVEAEQTAGGPAVPGAILLHYNGSAWRQVAASNSVLWPQCLASDGSGGLWLEGAQVGPGNFPDFLYHYSGGRLSSGITIPAPKNKGAAIALAAVQLIPGTRSVWAVGGALGAGYPQAVILKDGA